MRHIASFAFVFAFASLTAVQASAQAPWDFEGKQGALNWGKLDPAYKACAQGHSQSPIDLRGAHLNAVLQPLQFHYISGPVQIENDGHSVVVHVHPGSYMVADGVRYDLVSFDFRHPSEHAVKGKLTDMEVHLLHQSADGKLAILAIRMTEDVSNPNATLSVLWQHLPKTAGHSEKVTEPVNPAGLFPADRGYWTYTGSLTTPPCTEGVRWFVFEQELALSRDQLRAYAALFRINTRAIQDTHGRRIEANE
jgi:carbonic anhydrase